MKVRCTCAACITIEDPEMVHWIDVEEPKSECTCGYMNGFRHVTDPDCKIHKRVFGVKSPNTSEEGK